MADYSILQQQILSDIKMDPKIQMNLRMLNQKIENGTATYDSVAEFSKVLGDLASKSIRDNIGEDIAEDELEKLAQECLAPVYRQCQDTMLGASKSIQKLYNDQAGINLNPVEVKRDENRISNLVDRFKEAESYNDVAFLTGANTARSITRGAVTDSVRENAKFQDKVGIDVLISRSDGSGCCDWCSSVCGTFKSFDALPDGFWGIHRGCSCVIDYRVGKTKSRLSYMTDAKGNVRKNTEEINLEAEESTKNIKALEKSTLVDMNTIKSNEFRRKLDEIIPDVNERRAVEKSIIEILEHRTGTHFEDLCYINTTGTKKKSIINKDYDYYDPVKHMSQCIANKPMNEMIRTAGGKNIIAVHNHPTSNHPSMSDINSARNKQYKYGIICCHDGTIYKYSVAESFKDEFNSKIHLADMMESFYNGDKEGINESVKRLSTLGIEIEVI